MFHILLIALLSSTTISYMHCAETKTLSTSIKKRNSDDPKEESNPIKKLFQKKSTRSFSTSSTSSIIKSPTVSSQQNVCTSTSAPTLIPKTIEEHLFLKDVRNGNIERITQHHFSNPCLKYNMCDAEGNTPLHIVIANWDIKLIEVFTGKPEVDPTLKNKKNEMAHYLIPKTSDLLPKTKDLAPRSKETEEEEIRIIKCKLFKAFQIHTTTLQECQGILAKKPLGDITPEEQLQTVLKIKQTIEKTETRQTKDNTNESIDFSDHLPDGNRCSKYDFTTIFTDQFITHKIYDLLKQEKKRLKKLEKEKKQQQEQKNSRKNNK